MKTKKDRIWNECTDVNVLKVISTPSLGIRHTPVNHGEVLKEFRDQLYYKNYTIDNEYGYVSPNKMIYFYIASIHDSKNMVGFINYNNKLKSFKCIVGRRYNDHNIAISIPNSVKCRHTASVWPGIAENIQGVIDKFSDTNDLNIFDSDKKCSPDSVGYYIIEILRKCPYISNSDVHRIIDEWDKFKDEKTVGNFIKCVVNVIERITNPVSRLEIMDSVISIIKKENKHG